MIIEVIIGKSENAKGRSFNKFSEASYYMMYNEKQAKLHLQDNLVDEIESEPKYKNELMRKVYQNRLGQKRFYIMKVIN